MPDSKSLENRLHAWIGGQVQGVGFRMFVQERAVSLSIIGWVRNRWDGRVEVVAEGERNQLEQFLGKLRDGPRSAHVSELKFEWKNATGEFKNFGIRRTD